LSPFRVQLELNGLTPLYVQRGVRRRATRESSHTFATAGTSGWSNSSLCKSLSDALGDLLEANPEVQRLELESRRGSVSEGLELAELVQKYSLATAVTTYRDSACTLLFVAGRERILESEGELGCHRCRSRLWYHALLFDGESSASSAISESNCPAISCVDPPVTALQLNCTEESAQALGSEFPLEPLQPIPTCSYGFSI